MGSLMHLNAIKVMMITGGPITIRLSHGAREPIFGLAACSTVVIELVAIARLLVFVVFVHFFSSLLEDSVRARKYLGITQPDAQPNQGQDDAGLQRELVMADMDGDGAAQIRRDHQETKRARTAVGKKKSAGNLKHGDENQLPAGESQRRHMGRDWLDGQEFGSCAAGKNKSQEIDERVPGPEADIRWVGRDAV